MPIADLFSGLKKPVLVMDGGLGSTLEEICKTPIAATSLWSAEALDKEPEAIVAAHLAFLRAGAEIVETSTYQCSFDTFKRAGYSSGEAWPLMRRSILLAQQARAIFEKEMQLNNEKQRSGSWRSDSPRIQLCLSLGPFGASLKPTQEFGGFYPPPYGPQGYSTDDPNTNFIGDEKVEEEAVEALTAFHSERLLLFAQDSEIWPYIDMIAFETVPLAREAIAIRQTMARLKEKNIDVGKQWWISFVFPEGHCPQMMDAAGTQLAVPDLVQVVLSPPLPGQHGGRSLPVPHGLGINCTNIGYLPRIIHEMEGACEQIEGEVRPFLVLYPNGGGEFDVNLGAWKEGVNENAKNEWEITLVDLVDKILSSPDVKWSGVIAGGCCRCGAEQISRLSKLLK